MIRKTKMVPLEENTTEQKILDAARTVFMKHGLSGARMQEIADTACINKALLHYYFRSKDKLFDKVFEGAFASYLLNLDFLGDNSLPIKERLFKYVDNYIDFLIEYPDMPMFIIKEISVNPELFNQKMCVVKKKAKFRLVDILRKEIEAGNLPEIDPRMLFMNIHSLCSYPFAAKAMFKEALKITDKEWSEMEVHELRKSVKRFISHITGE